jgi:RNA polymerase sigma-70 factor (ECF subfamily)
MVCFDMSKLDIDTNRCEAEGAMRMSGHVVIHEQRLLKAARAGDEAAFRRLVEVHRPMLYARCYRMLGSVHDADDAMQETLLRAWRGLPGFDGRAALRPWLHRIATNASLDLLKRRSNGATPIALAPDDEQVAAPEEEATSPAARYERRETVELAVVAALQHLPASQRAALVLSDVLGFSGRETAHLLDTTPASVYSSVQRARKVVDERLPAPSEQPGPSSLRDQSLKDVVDRYMRAIDRADVGEIVSMLSAEASVAA